MSSQRHGGVSPAVIESIAGLSAGTVSTLVVHPLDIVKTRMQSKFPLLTSSQFKRKRARTNAEDLWQYRERAPPRTA